VDSKEAYHFFQFVSNRYEKHSTIITSNKSFDDWQELFGDAVTAPGDPVGRPKGQSLPGPLFVIFKNPWLIKNDEWVKAMPAVNHNRRGNLGLLGQTQSRLGT